MKIHKQNLKVNHALLYITFDMIIKFNSGMMMKQRILHGFHNWVLFNLQRWYKVAMNFEHE